MLHGTALFGWTWPVDGMEFPGGAVVSLWHGGSAGWAGQIGLAKHWGWARDRVIAG